jgi:hypothetical protein
LTRNWNRELDYRVTKEVWTFRDSRIATRFAYEGITRRTNLRRTKPVFSMQNLWGYGGAMVGGAMSIYN